MKQRFIRFLSCVMCGVILTSADMSGYSAAAEEAVTGTVTVTVYDDETGELMDAEVYLKITESTEALMNTVGHSFGIADARWHIATDNPCTLTDLEFHPSWFQMVEISSQNDPEYYYTINTERSDDLFYLSESPQRELSIYLTKTKRERFLVYQGTHGEEEYPLFRYFYTTNISPTVNRSRQVYYPGQLDMDLTYGDVLTTDEEITVSNFNSQTYYIYQITEEPVFTKIGNCADLFDARTLTVSGIKYHDFSNDPSLEGDIRFENADYHSFVLTDGDGIEYQFNLDFYNTSTEISLKQAKCGDTFTAAMQSGMAILPLTEPLHMPDIMGDVNEDRDFTVADLVLMQKWLLCVPDTTLGDWIAGDFNGDAKLDASDLSLMKQAFIANTKEPHCTMTVVTNYGGYGYSGDPLPSGTFTETFVIAEGDTFYETHDGHWLKNANNRYDYEGKIAFVESFDADSVNFTVYVPYYGATEYTVSYGDLTEASSTFSVADGINYDYVISFSDFADLE